MDEKQRKYARFLLQRCVRLKKGTPLAIPPNATPIAIPSGMLWIVIADIRRILFFKEAALLKLVLPFSTLSKNLYKY